ncbi:hypothetical protein BgiMline_036570, partial [Biomphalaria glabrata]
MGKDNIFAARSFVSASSHWCVVTGNDYISWFQPLELLEIWCEMHLLFCSLARHLCRHTLDKTFFLLDTFFNCFIGNLLFHGASSN